MKWIRTEDSTTIARIAYAENDLYIEFIRGGEYQYFDVPYSIYEKILNKECISKSEGIPSHGATLDQLVKKAGYEYQKLA